MKFILFISIMSCCILVSAQIERKYSVYGAINGLEDGKRVYLLDYLSAKDTISWTVASGGKFILKGSYSTEGRSCIIDIEGYGTSPMMQLFLDDTIYYVGGSTSDFSNIGVVSSSASFNEHRGFFKVIFPKLVAYNDFINQYFQERFVRADSIRRMKKDFILRNPNSKYSAFLLYANDDDDVAIKGKAREELYNQLGREARNSYYGLRVKESIEISNAADARKKSIKAEVAKVSTEAGAALPDFSLHTPDGNTTTINETVRKGEDKLILLDLWASWCAPCRKENPDLLSLYNQYHAKGFNIIGISLDTKAEAWKKAIKQDGLVWDHLSDLKGYDSYAHLLFKGGGVPYKVLLDGKGKIIAKGVGIKELKLKLKEIFGS